MFAATRIGVLSNIIAMPPKAWSSQLRTLSLGGYYDTVGRTIQCDYTGQRVIACSGSEYYMSTDLHRSVDYGQNWTTSGLSAAWSDVRMPKESGATKALVCSYYNSQFKQIDLTSGTTTNITPPSSYTPGYGAMSDDGTSIMCKGGYSSTRRGSGSMPNWFIVNPSSSTGCTFAANSDISRAYEGAGGTVYYYVKNGSTYNEGVAGGTTGFATIRSVDAAGVYVFAVGDTSSNIVSRSTNSGVSFSSVTLPASLDAQYPSVACSSTGQYVVAGAGLSVFYSSDYGVSFSQLPEPPAYVYKLCLSGDGKVIYIMNNQGAIYRYR